MRIDTEGRDLTLVAAALLFGAAAIVLSAAGNVFWLAPLGVSAVLVASSSRVEQEARARSKAEYNEILAGLELRDAAEHSRQEALEAEELAAGEVR